MNTKSSIEYYLPVTGVASPLAARTSRRGFSLLELLTVIAIISVIASLVISGAGVASRNAKLKMAQAQRDQLITVIDAYFAKRGVYPPDNPNLSRTAFNTLYYELTGTINTNGTFIVPGGGSVVGGNLLPVFGVGGFANSAISGGDTGDQPMQNFLKDLKDNQKMTFTTNGVSFTLLCVALPNPYVRPAAPPSPWNYVAAPRATNNPATYDLWVDVVLGGRTNRISNWNKQPQVVAF